MPCELFHLVPGLLDQSREGHTPALPSHSHHHAVFASDLVRTVSIWLLHWPHRLLYLDHLIWAQAFTVGASTSTHFCSSSNHTSTLLTHPVCQHLQFRSPTYDGECDIDLLSVTETMWWSMGSYSALSYRTIISPRRPKKGHTKSPPPWCIVDVLTTVVVWTCQLVDAVTLIPNRRCEGSGLGSMPTDAPRRNNQVTFWECEDVSMVWWQVLYHKIYQNGWWVSLGFKDYSYIDLYCLRIEQA